MHIGGWWFGIRHWPVLLVMVTVGGAFFAWVHMLGRAKTMLVVILTPLLTTILAPIFYGTALFILIIAHAESSNMSLVPTAGAASVWATAIAIAIAGFWRLLRNTQLHAYSNSETQQIEFSRSSLAAWAAIGAMISARALIVRQLLLPGTDYPQRLRSFVILAAFFSLVAFSGASAFLVVGICKKNRATRWVCPMLLLAAPFGGGGVVGAIIFVLAATVVTPAKNGSRNAI